MSTTSFSLLDGLKREGDPAAWRRLFALYAPLIGNWVRRHELGDQDVEDLVQEVLTVLVRKLPEFEREPRTGAFRCWLKSITLNCLREFWRAQRFRPAEGRGDFTKLLEQLDDPRSGLSQLWDKQHDDHVTRRLLEIIRPRFQPKTWQAFQRVALEGAAVDQVALELGLSLNAVFIAKSRVIQMLRQEGRGLID